VKDAEALAQKYRKSTRKIMIAAGLGVQQSRNADNFANKFKTWYSHEHPSGEGGKFSYDSLVLRSSHSFDTSVVTFLEYVAEIHQAYRKFKAENPTTNKKDYEKACQPIHDYCKSLQNVIDFSDESRKSMVARMDSVKEKFTDLVGLPYIFA
jgi:hypothetical protein